MKALKSKDLLKLLLELVVIFLSVVLAFFFDDYRENRSQREQYKADLITFNSELADVIGSVYSSVDSFQVSGDPGYRGRALRELLDLLWLDSLVDKRKATMADFRYVVKNYYLEAFRPGYKVSPLANEIRTKYNTQTEGRNILVWLRIYEEEMTNLEKGNVALMEQVSNVIGFVSRTSPDLAFDKQDSLLFYSKEARWAFKKVTMLQQDLYGFEKYLAQKRLAETATGINNELLALGVENLSGPGCHPPAPDFKKRYECEYGRSITDKDLVRIKDVLIRERNEYLRESRK